MPQGKLKVIYIAGYGRSGTTLLDIALGQQPGVFGAGEITALARHVWKEREFCACREKADECGFWGRVVNSWLEGRKSGAMDAYGKRLARSEWLFDPRRLLWRFGAGREARAYREETAALFREIAEASGDTVIVDSSKLPGRASALMSVPGIELYVVHVVRDGRGVAWSMMKPYKRAVDAGLQKEVKPKPLWQAAVRWFTVNIGAEIVRLRLPRERSMRVRYEDFVADPGGKVKSILDFAGEEYVQPPYGADLIKPQHQIAGNRSRMQNEIRLRRDIGWTSQMPRSDQTVFSALAAPLLAKYGYFGSPPRQGTSERERDSRIPKELT
ncbi:sulfotransferase family protein [Aurantiacibacter hainanensis]|uniref:sulfotransferase family protein n=1 Tax=Aurantiacibacter hainanensis TaxID=3076114 RepID=UPI0030C73F27